MNGFEWIPREVSGRLPLLMLTGTERFQIEQHQGLAGFHDNKISFRTASGSVIVTGTDMKFVSYTGSTAIISGNIAGICFMKPGEET